MSSSHVALVPLLLQVLALADYRRQTHLLGIKVDSLCAYLHQAIFAERGGGCQEDLWKTVNFDGSDMGFAGAVKEQCARCADAAAASRTGARWPQGVRPTSLEMNANSLRRASDVRAQ